jgi:muconate cycloisomerase
MQIEKIRIYDVNIPFCRVVKHGLFTRKTTESIIIVLEDVQGNKGFGEGTPRDYVTGETLDNCLKSTVKLAKKLAGRKFESFKDVKTFLTQTGESPDAKASPAAFCAIETAVLDIWARINKEPIWKFFSPDVTSDIILSYSGVIPYIKQEKEFLQSTLLVKKLKLRSLKVKVIDMESGLSQLKYLRDQLGTDVDIRIDANAAFSPDEAIRFINRAKTIRLSAVEQPVSKLDLKGLKEVTRNSDIPIIADESMYTPEGPAYLIENDICHGFNIRLSSCGGFLKAFDLYSKARSRNMTVVIGAHVGETAVLTFAGRNFAVMCQEYRYLEGSFSRYVLKDDLVPEDIAFGNEGIVPVPTGSGLGIELKESSLKGWSDMYASIEA